MSWGDSHCNTFTPQAEACGRADHADEKVALSATAPHSKHFECPVQVGVSRLQTSESLRRACDIQCSHGVRRTVLGVAGH
jgi:hypothetical protein